MGEARPGVRAWPGRGCVVVVEVLVVEVVEAAVVVEVDSSESLMVLSAAVLRVAPPRLTPRGLCCSHSQEPDLPSQPRLS